MVTDALWDVRYPILIRLLSLAVPRKGLEELSFGFVIDLALEKFAARRCLGSALW
jgi:hypothetical protein